MSARELQPVGPIDLLDRALLVARRGGVSRASRAWFAGAVPAAVVAGIYYLERVEGVRGLRPLFGVALVVAWCARALLLSGVAREGALALWEGMPLPAGAGRSIDVVRTALVTALGLWVWAWLLVVASFGGAIGVVFVLPLFALRGAIAPAWLARAACTTDAGVRGFVRAAGDNSDMRTASVLMEALVLAGAIGLTIDLYALLGFGALIGRSFFGLELALVDSFLSPDNTFVLLGVLLGALVLLEPLRAAVAAVLFVDARVRQEGLDLRASLDDAIAASARVAGSSAARAALVLAAVCVLGAGSAHAQVSGGADGANVGTPTSFSEDAADTAARARVDAVLARPEFQEFSDARGRAIQELLSRLFAWLLRPRDTLHEPQLPMFHLPLPGGWFFMLIGGALIVAVLAYLLLTQLRGARAAQPGAAAAVTPTDLRERPPEQFLDDAGVLAQKGQLREALRALYLATLVALDRRRLITFDPHRTNWQYLRQMPRSDARSLFADFTRIFDHKWYGAEPTTQADYEACRSLASRIVAQGAAEVAA
jgi:hypothetical protein